MITEETLLKEIREFSQCSNQYYTQSKQIEENIQEYLDGAPSKITVYDEYIRIQIAPNNFTNVVLDKLEKLLYKLHDGDILIPVPRPVDTT